MTIRDRLWDAALVEHETVVRDYVAIARERGADGRWASARTPGAWSPAAVTLHICRAYELGREAALSPTPVAMRRLAAPWVAMLSRTFILPLLIVAGRFPTGVRAPREVVPDLAEAAALAPESAIERLERAAADAADALRTAARERPSLRFGHAYFGPLTPYAAFRLLSAHTRHHTRGLAAEARPA